MKLTSTLDRLRARIGATLWSLRGRRRLRRGDSRGAVRAYEASLRRRPGGFVPLMRLAIAHLCARELPEARRYLADARTADPVRFERDATTFLAQRGFDLDAIHRVPPAPRPRLAPAVKAGVSQAAPPLIFGDCKDIDEYARFQAMPPITTAEIESLDIDRLLDDLREE